jgi:hypothetical protein
MRAQEFITEEFKNIVVPPTVTPTSTAATSGVSLTGRNPTSPDQVTHAYRLMSVGELEHAQQKGAFLPNPNADRANGWNTNHKYWSSGDAQGQFGRPWGGDARIAVRVPIDKVLPTTPVNANHAEVLDKTTGKWAPLQPSTASTKSRSYTSRMSTGGGSGGSMGGHIIGKMGQSPSLDYPIN